MRCPFCNSDDTRVIDSRLADNGDSVRRRRVCQQCEERFTTLEMAQLKLPQIIKNDGTREAFAENKLRRGMHKALEKRPVEADAVEEAVQRILRRMTKSGEREISSRMVGESLMCELRDLDAVAYVRFASVYHQFQNLDEFSEEVKRLQSESSPQVKRRQMNLLPNQDQVNESPGKS